METLLADLRQALRVLGRRPTLTLIAVLTLALGVGANTAVWSVVYGVMLRPLGFGAEDRLAAIVATHPELGEERPGSALPDYWHYREHQHSFEELSFYCWQSMTLEGGEQVEQLQGLYVGGELFSMLGLEPHLGRLIAPDDATPGRGHVAVASHALFTRRFGGDPEAIGSTLRVDGETLTLIGVLPPGTALPSPHAELYVPVGQIDDPYGRFSREERDFQLVGRLAAGVSREAAAAEMQGLAQQLAVDHPATNADWSVAVRPWRELLIGAARGPIWLAFGAVILVLALACANIAHLLLVQVHGREREWTIRAALGAGRGRLLRQILTESIVLAVASGAVGMLAAVWLHDAVLALDPGILPRRHAVALDLPVLASAFLATLLAGLACGVVPALRGASAGSAGLAASGERTLGRSHGGFWRVALLGAEVALALVLLSGAGLLIRAFDRLEHIDPGFEPANVYAAHVVLDAATYLPLDARRAYFRRLQAAVAALPGVESAALGSATPVPDLGIAMDMPYRPAGQGPPLADLVKSASGAPRAALNIATPDYFETLGLPIVRGRALEDQDTEHSTLVALVNQTLARRLFPGQNPLGQRFEILAFGEELQYEVIGVVGDTRFAGLHLPPRPAFFLAHAQMPFMGMSIIARSRLAEGTFAASLRRAMLAIDPAQPFNQVRSLERELGRSLGVERFFAALLGLLALLALGLAAAGIYGVFSYWVSQRTREIGLRMALGARAGQVLRQVVGQGLTVTLAGLLAGLGGAFWASRLMARAFRGVAALDVSLLAVVVGILVFMAFVACYFPARRASRVEPSVALRGE